MTTTTTQDIKARIAQRQEEIRVLEATLRLLGLDTEKPEVGAPRRLSSTGHPFGNGEPDAELAEAAGLGFPGNVRPDKWRKYLALRRSGKSFWVAATKTNIHKHTAQRLESLV